MLVDVSLAEPVATHVWFEPRTMLLSVEINGIVESIDFRQIPPEDFESTAPIVKFGMGQGGSVVVCHHHDGEETWLPVDMWLPGGFTPPSPEATARIN
jgi:hypothetical protein